MAAYQMWKMWRQFHSCTNIFSLNLPLNLPKISIYMLQGKIVHKFDYKRNSPERWLNEIDSLQMNQNIPVVNFSVRNSSQYDIFVLLDIGFRRFGWPSGLSRCDSIWLQVGYIIMGVHLKYNIDVFYNVSLVLRRYYAVLLRYPRPPTAYIKYNHDIQYS